MSARLKKITNIIIFFKRFFKAGEQALIAPKSLDEDERRQEFILNVILLVGLLLLVVFDGLILWQSLVLQEMYKGMSFFLFSVLVLVVAGMLALSRIGYFKFSSYIFVTLLFLLISFSAFKWGIDLPSVLMGYSLVVVTSSILIGTNFGFWLTCVAVIFIGILGIAEIKGDILPDIYWKHSVLGIDNLIEYTVMLFFLTVVSWLSNREIEKSLFRARGSEFELKLERDSLEVKVGERTRELREIQQLQLSQHSQFVELGRLAGGYVHDLANPLTVLSLSIEQLNASQFGPASEALNLAMDSCKRMEKLLVALRKQLKQQDNKEWFLVGPELKGSVRLLGSKAVHLGVNIRLDIPNKDLFIFGNITKFNQIASNLIANAIESYGEKGFGSEKTVVVTLFEDVGFINLIVQDFGCGIPQENLKKIFEPMFTTKGHSSLGMGLSTVSTIVENDFKGQVSVISVIGQGTKFSVLLPLENKVSGENLFTGSEQGRPPSRD